MLCGHAWSYPIRVPMLRYGTSMGHGTPKDVSWCLRWVYMMVHIRKIAFPHPSHFDERGCLRKVLTRLHARFAGWAGLGLVLGTGRGGGGWGKCLDILTGGGGWEECLRGCMRGCRVGWAGIGAGKLPWVDARKKCSRCSPTRKCLGKVVPTIPWYTMAWKQLLPPSANVKSRL